MGLRSLDEQSAQPVGPTPQKRPAYLDTVLGATPNDAVTSRRRIYPASTLLAIPSQRKGIDRAFLRIFIRFCNVLQGELSRLLIHPYKRYYHYPGMMTGIVSPSPIFSPLNVLRP